MRTTSVFILLLVPLLLAGGATRAAAAVEASPTQRPTGRGGGGTGGKAAEEAFYHKVGNFAVVIYSIWHHITPAPALERVVSATTRPARGNAVDYILVLRVAGLGTCRALVWGIPGKDSQDWKLKYFKPDAL